MARVCLVYYILCILCYSLDMSIDMGLYIDNHRRMIIRCQCSYPSYSMGENGETKMAELNGKTPAVIAKEIVNDAVTPATLIIDGVCSQHLDTLARKENKDAIEARGENFWVKNRDRF